MRQSTEEIFDQFQTNTYLDTGKDFEEIFNIEDELDSKETFQTKVAAFKDVMQKNMSGDKQQSVKSSFGDIRPRPETKVSSNEKGKIKANTIFGKQGGGNSENQLLRYKRWKKLEEDFICCKLVKD